MKRTFLMAIVLVVSTICYSQTRVGDFNKINVRQLLHSNGMYLIYPDVDTLIQFRYDNMADPDSPLDGVNLRTLQAFSDTSTTAATDSLFLEFANEWLANGDTIVEDDSMAYFRYPIEDCDWCIQIKHPKDNTWSPTICRESGLSNLFISENAERIYRIENNGVDRIGFIRDDQPASMFPKNPDFSLMAKQNGKYNFFPNVILGEKYTAYGYGAGEVIGIDTIIKFGSYQNPNTGEFEIIDTVYYYPKYGAQNFDNVVLVGHNSRPTANDQIAVGDTTMQELRTYGTIKAPNYATKKAVGVGYDTLFTKHLVINVKDTAKFAKRMGDSIYWELLPVDSFYIGEKWLLPNDSLTIVDQHDSIFYSNSSKWLSNGDTLTTTTIDKFINLTDTPEDYTDNDEGYTVIEQGDSVVFNSKLGADNGGAWARSNSETVVLRQFFDMVNNGSTGSGVSLNNMKKTTITERGHIYNGYTVDDSSEVGVITYVKNNCIYGNVYSGVMRYFKGDDGTARDSIVVKVNGDLIYSLPSTNIPTHSMSWMISTFNFNFTATTAINEIKAEFYNNRSKFEIGGDSAFCGTDWLTINGESILDDGSFRIVNSSHNTIYEFPAYDGAINQSMVTDGNGKLVWSNVLRADTITSISTDTLYVPTIRVDTIFVANQPINLESDSLFHEAENKWVANGDTIKSGSMSLKDLWSGTQAEYDALTPDANTIYFINQGYGFLGLLILLLTFLGSNAQNWSAVKVGSTDVVKIYQGEDVIWEKPMEDWTYEGVMVIGNDSNPPQETYGYMFDDPSFGSIDPIGNFIQLSYLDNNGDGDNSLEIQFNEPVILETTYINGEIIPTLEIYGDGSYWYKIGITNPFPPVGETCEIKLKYTLN